MKILRVKSKLKGKDIYIDSELTLEERSIQRKIRDKAREERNRGARVRVKYQQLEETKQKGQEIITLDGYTLFNSGGENRRLGVGFLLRNDFKDKVVDFEPVSERQGKYRKISLLNVHAPTDDKDPIVKSEFYEELEKVLEKVPKFDIKLVLGDLNAKIGREDEHRKVTGGNSKHMLSSENGKMLIQFALENNLKIMSTNFKHKEIHQTTWMSPDFKTRNQIAN
ncbi:hypothetical protein QE152_g19059 [Popillia japonica]|uniref:Craniofacial development protein 2-like n=1 Tax=Popillia japonica TaxID=7064 RepID=A0AAW1L4Q8_POPJA